MFPPELTIVHRNWLNDNINKTIIFNKFMNGSMEEKDVIYRGHIVGLAYKKYLSWMNCILSFCLKYETSTGPSQPTEFINIYFIIIFSNHLTLHRA